MKQRRTRVKVCGITQVDQAYELANLGVDAIGVIFAPQSPRLLDVRTARQIRQALPPFVSLVGVFVDASPEDINMIVSEAQLDIVQLHGVEHPSMISEINRPCIKAIRAKTRVDVVDGCNRYTDASALLIDPYVKGQHGGTGQQINPDVWPNSSENSEELPLILAGGLSSNNLGESLEQFNPYAVDLNSGVESSPGVKCMNLVEAAVDVVRSYDHVSK